MARWRRPSLSALVTFGAVVAAAAFVFNHLEPALLFKNNTPAGGDMGAQVWGPAFMRDYLLPRGKLTGWSPDWYAGFPAYVFYFPLPSLLVAAADLLLPYGVAFKLVTAAGPVALPVAAYAFARLAGLRFPAPAVMAVASLPFLFDTSFSIYGGNIASTLAGEFAFSISLALALVFVGMVARGLTTGGRRATAAIVFAATVLSHVIPAIFAVAAAVIVLLVRLDPRRIRYLATVGAVGALLTGFWTLPLAVRSPYANDMGWEKVTDYSKILFSEHIRWVFPFAISAVGVSVYQRLRAGIALSAIAAVAAAGFVLAPEGRIWNARLLPFWYLCVYLLAGLGVAEVGRSLGATFGTGSARAYRFAALATALAALWGGLWIVGRPLDPSPPGSLPARPGRVSFIPDWARWNYSGYEGKAAYPEYRALIGAMGKLPCGRAMWEYDKPLLDRYGTPMALMLLPYWTDGCIGSMEGLYFESSATTPFHFLNASELSKAPSNAQRGLPYQPLNVALGVKHLQLWGVRYYMAFSPAALVQAEANPDLKQVAASGPWKVFEVARSRLVQPLSFEPAVVEGVGNDQKSWLPMAVQFYLDPRRWDVFLAADGPAGWRKAALGADPARLPVRPARVSGIRTGAESVSFKVDRPGSPVLVKVSYFPNWKAYGAEGPWRVAPNMMVVVPTQRQVQLRYESTLADRAGVLATLAGLVALVPLARRRIAYPQPDDPGIWTRGLLRHVAVVSLAATAVDVAVLAALRLWAGLPLALAGAASIAAAAAASFYLTRLAGHGDDPHLRWIRRPGSFLAVTATAGLVDVAALSAAGAVLGSTKAASLVAAKVIALAAAGGVRLAAYRGTMFRAVRSEQALPARRPKAPGSVRLSVVIPAFKEEASIARTLSRLRRVLGEMEGGVELIVVDDGSPDGTARAAGKAGADRVIVLEGHRGKGAALRAGVAAAGGRTVAYTDADLSYDPHRLLKLVDQVEAGWDLAVGSRLHMGTGSVLRAGRLREVSGRVFNLLTRALLLGQYRDTQCGLKAFRSDVARLLFAKARVDGFAIDVELLHLAERYRLSLKEVPVSVDESRRSTVRVTTDALGMVRDLFLIRSWAGQGAYDLPEDHPTLPGLEQARSQNEPVPSAIRD